MIQNDTHAIQPLCLPVRLNHHNLRETVGPSFKVIYLAVQAASKKWTMPIRNWKLALNRFMIEFEDRLADYI